MSYLERRTTAQSDNFLARWIRGRTGTTGVALLAPEVYPDRRLEVDERSINMELQAIASEITDLEDEANEEGMKAANAESDALELIHKQNAAHALKEIHQKKDRVERLGKKRGLILSIQHARMALQGDDLDLMLDEVLDGENADELADEIRSALVDLGMNDDDIDQIAQTLDINLPSGEAESDYMEAVDEQVSQLKAQQIDAEEFDVTDARDETESAADHSRVRDRRDRH